MKENRDSLEINFEDELDTEAILYQVANGQYKATIADNHIFAANKYMSGLKKGPTIAEKDEIAWAIRPNGPDLENHVINSYVSIFVTEMTGNQGDPHF